MKSPIAEDFHQQFVVSNDDEIVTSLGEILCLLKSPCHCKGFSFDSCCSSEERNGEPARVIFHPPWKQLGTLEGQRNLVEAASTLCLGWTNWGRGKYIFSS